MSDDFDFDFDLNLDGASVDGFGFSPSRKTADRIGQILEFLSNNDTTAALDLLDALKADDGATPVVQHLLALCLARLGRVVPAIRLLRAAHEASPDAYEHTEVLASLLALVGEQAESVYFAKLSTALGKKYPQYELVPAWIVNFSVALMMTDEDPLTGHGYTQMLEGAYDTAVESFVDALELNKNDRQAWAGLVAVNMFRHRPGDSLRAAEALVAVADEAPDTLMTLARCQLGLGDIGAAWDTVNKALQQAGADPAIAQALPGMVPYDSAAPAALGVQLASAWAQLAAIVPKPVTVAPRPNDQAQFRVGVLSGKISAGSDRIGVLSTIEECIGRAAALYYYCNNETEDAVSRRVRRAAIRWRGIHDVDDETVAAIIRNDEIQILIDLDGFDWTGRPGVVARKPAAVVLSAMVEPGAVAGPGIYALGEPWFPGFENAGADRVALAEGLSTWPLYVKSSEESVSASNGMLRVAIDGPAARLSDGFAAILAQCLGDGVNMALILRGDDPSDAGVTEVLSQRFAAVGLDLGTVQRLPHGTALDEMLRSADILLDTQPIPSVEAAYMALRMGVPVLSHKPRNASNTAVASLLMGMGLSDWIAEDGAALRALLSKLAENPGARAEARESVRKAVETASSLDTRLKRGRAFASLFDDLLARAAEDAK